MPGSFTTRPDLQFPAADIVAAISHALDGGAPLQFDATRVATALLGDAIATNLFMLGYPWQQGLVPLSFESLMTASQLNGAPVETTKPPYPLGRLAPLDPQALVSSARP